MKRQDLEHIIRAAAASTYAYEPIGAALSRALTRVAVGGRLRPERP
jgi:hypothetical protein